MDTIERKLMKKGRKLAKFARKHGLGYADIGIMAPDEYHKQWFINVTAHGRGGRNNVSAGDFIGDGELDE